MTPVQLFEMCLESIRRWEADGGHGTEPTIMLVVPKTRCPSGDTVTMFGRHGPRGRIATVRETAAGYDVVAYFPAVAVVERIAEAIGVPSPVVKTARRTSQEHRRAPD